jgi:predicted Rossmann fold flavoprotein
VVLATGGLSLPKTGSDGAGYRLATELGHSLVPTTPALVPLTLTSEDGVPEALSGVALPARLDLRLDGRIAAAITGPLLWTHVGISGPAALDVSRHWLRAQIDGRPAQVSASFAASDDFESIEAAWVALAAARPRLAVQTAVSAKVPAAMAGALLRRAATSPDQRLATLTREQRRALVHALVAWPMPITGSRGYNYAEVTAGGIPLAEISPATMASRLCSGLYFAGEILDVDGRLGGFNFQWAWSSGRRAAEGLASLIGSQGLTMGRS